MNFPVNYYTMYQLLSSKGHLWPTLPDIEVHHALSTIWQGLHVYVG